MRPRIQSMDALRGVCALGVLIYHFAMWSGFATLANLGLYAVEIFFVVSGFSLATAYADRDVSWGDYLARRFLRLAPLFLIATAATLAVWLYLGKNIDPLASLASLVLLPIALSPSLAVPAGGWSIGVEIAFYLVFPFLARLPNRWLVALAGFSLVWTTAHHGPWAAYVMPANHLFFFLAGVLIARAPLISPLWAAAGLITLFKLPEASSGYLRLAAALSCALIVWAVAAWREPPRILSRLGQISYSLYLLHPLAWLALFMFDMQMGWHLSAATALSLTAAALSYRLIERPCCRLGDLTDRHAQLATARASEGQRLRRAG